jgi:2,4-dienoyl-CoA reductase-like NADH-dependent reductase (Old Yellow Enzyme family)
MNRYTAETAAAAISSGNADVIAFGRPYLNNPDFPARVANGWPLNGDLPHKYWFTPNKEYKTPAGYIIPKYQPASA